MEQSKRRTEGLRQAGATLVVALAAIWLSACGGSGDGSTSADVSAEARAIRAADAICRQAREERAREIPKAVAELRRGTATSQAEIARRLVIAVGLPPIESMTERLRQLDPPGEWGDQLVAELDAAIAATIEDPTIALRSTDPFRQAKELAGGQGMAFCSDF